MTELDPQAAAPVLASPPATTAAASSPAPGGLRRVLNWFWRGRQLKELKRELATRGAAERALSQQAELLFELGNRALRPNERLPGSATAAAAELYRQSAYFGVRAALLDAGAQPALGEPWAHLPPALEQKVCAATAAESPTELATLVEVTTFAEPWALAEEQRSLLAARLGKLAQTLLSELSWRTRARDALWIQRLLRIGAVLGLVFGTIFGVSFFQDRSEQSVDLAYNKPWRTSSSMSGFGCNSPIQKCADSPDFFFHTLEEKGPWVEIDLGAPVRFSSVRIDNRRDCCFDRATPLIVEVSKDQQGFREVSRRTKSFSSWRARFAPTEARYIRIRAPSRTMLHLSQVRVLP